MNRKVGATELGIAVKNLIFYLECGKLWNFRPKKVNTASRAYFLRLSVGNLEDKSTEK